MKNIELDGPTETRSDWEPMRVTCVGKIHAVVQGGGGKLSATTGDPGEPFRKPPGQL